MPSTDLALHTLRELARNRTSFPQWAPHRRANSRDPTRSRFAPAQVHHETASLPTVTCYRLGHNRPLTTPVLFVRIRHIKDAFAQSGKEKTKQYTEQSWVSSRAHSSRLSLREIAKTMASDANSKG